MNQLSLYIEITKSALSMERGKMETSFIYVSLLALMLAFNR